jgi:hypothetical protein
VQIGELGRKGVQSLHLRDEGLKVYVRGMEDILNIISYFSCFSLQLDYAFH